MNWNPKATGWYPDVPSADYHAGPGYSSSDLKTALDCPARVIWRRLAASDSEPSKAMRVGTLVHAMVLEGMTLSMPPELDRRTAAGKAAYAEWVTAPDLAGAIRVESAEEGELVIAMSNALMAHEEAGLLLAPRAGRHYERSGYLTRQDGVPVRIRPDAMDYDSRTICDLKTAADASPEGFGRQVANLDYHLSAAMYMDAACAIDGMEWESWRWIVVESAAPHLVAVYSPSAEMMERGRARYVEALRIVDRCVENSCWPGYPSQALELPRWAAK